MSNASEVKRFIHWFGPDYDGSAQFSQEVVLASDHDRIMSERDKLWKRATKFVMPGEMDTGESIEHYIKTLEQTVAELRAEVAQAKREAADAMSGCCDCPMFKAQGKTVARQAKVIEKYQQAVTRIWVSSDNCEHDMEPNTTMDFFRCEKCGIPSAFAAIEKEGET